MSYPARRSGAAILSTYKICAVEASKALLKNPWLILLSCLAFVFYSIIANTFSGMGFAGGMLVGMVQIALIAMYYFWLSELIPARKVRFKDALAPNFALFSSVLSVAFIFFICTYLVQIVFQLNGIPWGVLLLQLAIVFIFNSIPEVLYIKNMESLEALSFSANFTKQNWIEWYLPLLLLVLPWVIKDPSSVLLVLASTNPFLPSLMLIESAGHWTQALGSSVWPGFFLGIVLTNWFMVFRGNLFERLDK